ncbi:MAG TPA: hypothetical protein VN969_27450 [Streptosporangiaceae bacterium]|nr:hypothetical protein [Streptosporangiaceae bacterium]
MQAPWPKQNDPVVASNGVIAHDLQRHRAVADSPRPVACRVNARYTEGPPQVHRRSILVPYERPAHHCGADTRAVVIPRRPAIFAPGTGKTMEIKPARPGRALPGGIRCRIVLPDGGNGRFSYATRN